MLNIVCMVSACNAHCTLKLQVLNISGQHTINAERDNDNIEKERVWDACTLHMNYYIALVISS